MGAAAFSRCVEIIKRGANKSLRRFRQWLSPQDSLSGTKKEVFSKNTVGRFVLFIAWHSAGGVVLLHYQGAQSVRSLSLIPYWRPSPADISLRNAREPRACPADAASAEDTVEMWPLSRPLLGGGQAVGVGVTRTDHDMWRRASIRERSSWSRKQDPLGGNNATEVFSILQPCVVSVGSVFERQRGVEVAVHDFCGRALRWRGVAVGIRGSCERTRR